MDDKTCGMCQHFLQHYTFDKRKIFRVYCGHCRLYHAKRKRVDSKACDDFVQNIEKEDPFVTKEFLSKELLKYVLSLELLPEISNEV